LDRVLLVITRLIDANVVRPKATPATRHGYAPAKVVKPAFLPCGD
jgi:hypothetical protein